MNTNHFTAEEGYMYSVNEIPRRSCANVQEICQKVNTDGLDLAHPRLALTPVLTSQHLLATYRTLKRAFVLLPAQPRPMLHKGIA